MIFNKRINEISKKKKKAMADFITDLTKSVERLNVRE